MIEVLSSFNCTANTFFVSIDIMDAYLTSSTRCLETKDIHLVGVTAMLLASKMEEIIPFKVSTVVDKMTHGKMLAKEVVRCEENILKTMDFELLSSPSLFVFIEMLVVKLNFHTTPFFKDIMKVVTYISKMILHDYSILTKYPMKYLASSCLYISFKIIEQVNRDFKTKVYVEKLKIALSLNEQIFYHVSETMLNLAKNFEKSFPFAKNLLKFDSFALEKDAR
jgi:cyclin B